MVRAIQSFARRRWVELANIDLRTLALFRVGLAITVLADLITFLPHFSIHLTDAGLFPRSLVLWERSWDAFSIFFISGRYDMTALLFALTALAAIALLFGYRTRLAIVLCWFMIVSLNVRANVFLSSADIQLAVLLFWAMFLPLGARFSIDHALSRKPTRDTQYATLAGLAVLLQETYLYVMGALLKTGEPWRVQFTAVESAVSNVQLKTYFSDFLLQWPEVMKWLTIYVYHLELYCVLFLFFPFFTARLRLLMFVLLASMHVGFYIFLDISFFPLISIVGLTVFIPGFVWDWLGPKMESWADAARLVIYYDEECAFCRKTCLIFRELSIVRSAAIVPAQSDREIHALMQKENSWVVKTPEGGLLLHWDAVAYLWRRSPILWPLGALFLPVFMRPLGRRIYRFIARNRGRFGKFSAEFLRERECVKTRLHPLIAIALLPLMAITFFWNIHNMPTYKNLYVPPGLLLAMNYTGLWQEWRMFAPRPTVSSKWVVVEGKLADGRLVDLLFDRDTAPSHQKPNLGNKALPTRRWQKFFEFFRWENGRNVFGRVFCRRWAERGGPVRLERVTVYEYTQQNNIGMPGADWPVVKTIPVDYACHVPPPTPRPKK